MKKSQKNAFAILGILNLHPSSGYDIKKITTKATGHFWRETDSSIYPMLRNLEKEGLITQKGTESHGQRERNIFDITDEGRKRFSEWLEHPVEYDRPRNELLLKLFLGGTEHLDIHRRHVVDFQQHLKQLSSTYSALYKEIGEKYPDHPELPLWLLNVRFEQLRVEGGLTWCKEALDLITEVNLRKMRTDRWRYAQNQSTS